MSAGLLGGSRLLLGRPPFLRLLWHNPHPLQAPGAATTIPCHSASAKASATQRLVAQRARTIVRATACRVVSAQTRNRSHAWRRHRRPQTEGTRMGCMLYSLGTTQRRSLPEKFEAQADMKLHHRPSQPNRLRSSCFRFLFRYLCSFVCMVLAAADAEQDP